MSVRLELKEKEKNVSLYAKLSFFLEATKVYRNSYIYICVCVGIGVKYHDE